MAVGVINSINAALAREATRPVRLAPGRPEKSFEANHVSPLKLESTPTASKEVILRELNKERIAPIGRDQSHRSPGFKGLQEAAAKIFGGKENYIQTLNEELEKHSGIKQDGTPGAREKALERANEDLIQKALKHSFKQTENPSFALLEKSSPEKQVEFYNNLLALADDKASKAASRFDSLLKKGADKNQLTKASVDFTIAALFTKTIKRDMESLEVQARSENKSSVARRLAAA